MATSGSVDLNYTRNDIINEALEQIGKKAAEQTIARAIYVSCACTLEMMIKTWMAAGIGLWKNQEIALFQSYEGYAYTIGPSGSHAAQTYNKTEISTAAASGAGTIIVDSITGITNGDYIGIELDDKTLQWTTVNGVPAGTTVTLTAVLTAAAAVDNHVYSYTTKAGRPLRISEARIHYPAGNETPLEIIGRNEYMDISSKTTTGTANQLFYEPLLTNGAIKVWPACSDVQYWLMFTGQMPVEDFDAGTNDIDFAQEWFLPVALNLALLLAPKFGVSVDPDLRANALMYKDTAQGFDADTTSVTFGSE